MSLKLPHGWRKLAYPISLAGFYLVIMTGWLLGWKAWAILFFVFYLITGFSSFLFGQGMRETNPEKESCLQNEHLLSQILISPAVVIFASVHSLFSRRGK